MLFFHSIKTFSSHERFGVKKRTAHLRAAKNQEHNQLTSGGLLSNVGASDCLTWLVLTWR